VTADGPRALDVIALHQPDVVLLDIRMPGKDGLSILHDLRATPEGPVVAMLTTFDSDEYIATAPEPPPWETGRRASCSRAPIRSSYRCFVRTPARRGVVLSPTVSGGVVQRYLSAGADPAGQGPGRPADIAGR